MAKDNAISRYYSKNVTPIHSVAERMKQRREFVMGKETAPAKSVGGGSPTPQVSPNTVPGSINDVLAQLLNPANATYYNDRVGQANNQSQAAYNSANDMVKNGIDGTAINPVPLGNNVASFYGANADRMDSLLNNLISGQVAQKNANTGQYSAQQTAGTNAYNAQTGRLNANVGAQNSGYGTDATGTIVSGGVGQGSGGSTSNPRIDNYVNAVMNGYKNISDIPTDISPRVMAELQKKGYDPAKELWGDLNGLQSTYNQGGSLATGNNYGSKLALGTGDLLNFVGIKTGGEKQKQEYIDASKAFASKYGNILGKNINLPTTSDTPDQAAKKFAALSTAVRNKFYNGGTGPGNNGSNTKDPLGLGL